MPGYKNLAHKQATKNEKEHPVISHFKEWNYGFHPKESSDEDIKAYLTHAYPPKEYSKHEVKKVINDSLDDLT